MEKFDEDEPSMLVDVESSISILSSGRDGEGALQVHVEDARLGGWRVQSSGVAGLSNLRGGAVNTRPRGLRLP